MQSFSHTALFVLFATLLIGFGQLAHAQTKFPPAYNNQATFAPGDLVTDYGNIYRCNVAVTKPYLDPSKTYENWEMFYVRNNTTLTIGIGQTFPDLATAWNYVHNARIAEGAYLHLSIVTTQGDFSESLNNPISLDMDNGSQVSIIGDNASNIQLTFPNTNGFNIDSGHSLGSISGLTLAGGNTSYAISATTSGSIANVSDLNITGFNYQIYADQTSNLNFGMGITLTHCFNYGCFADNGATIVFPQGGLSVTGPAGAGACLLALRGGRITAEQSTMLFGYNGANASYAGFIDILGSTITNANVGVVAINNGTVEATSCVFTNSSFYDISADNGGVVNDQLATVNKVQASNGGAIYSTP